MTIGTQEYDELTNKIKTFMSEISNFQKISTENITKGSRESANRAFQDKKRELEQLANQVDSYTTNIYKSSLDAFDRQVYEATEQLAKLVNNDKLSKQQRLQVEHAYSVTLEQIESSRAKEIERLEKESQKKRRDSLIEFYKLTKNDTKAAELELQKIKDDVEAMELTAAEKKEFIAQKEIEITIEKNIQKLKAKKEYYTAIGNLDRVRLIEAKIQELELQKVGASAEEARKRVFGDDLKKSNYNSLFSAIGLGEDIAGNLQSQVRAIAEFRESELQRLREYYQTTEELAEAHSEAMVRFDEAKFNATISTAIVGFSTLGSLLKQFNDLTENKSKTAARVMQGIAASEAIVKTYLAAQNAFASAPDPITGAIMSGIAIAQGMLNVAAIKRQKFHSGGVVGGSGEVDATLLSGEGVLSRSGMRALAEERLTQLNSGNSAVGGEAEIHIYNYFDKNQILEVIKSRSGRSIINEIQAS